MVSRRIRDNQIKASTVKKRELNTKGKDGRLNVVGGWCVEKLENYEYTQSNRKYKSFLPKEFLEVDLLSEKFIDGFATQGHSNRGLARFVTGYLVHYSLDGFSWDVISWEERERYFVANKNSRDTVRQYLNPRIRARYVRFVPVTWYNWICMRVEIYGCDAGESLRDKVEKKIIGKKPPTDFEGGPWMVQTQGFWAAALEVPQFIIQQRVDQAYDGGKPIWSKPAVVYVSGSVASVGVIILGIRKLYPYVKVSELTFP
ncbi:hypothetical protein pdam_00007287 [Pocillopora damicornis]|uniref:F5/8 type C domain-containing protein n=1 Tax=Pocillopora damicornis TaxID=46731 RepID=A0A3M6UN24_POCDA|nr:hypothetical protein pdam_00007287 [Pocillopora damicornis]